MYPMPSGPKLSPEQRRDLDDTFLSSDPHGYFNARINMLLRWAESGAENEKNSRATPNLGSQHANELTEQFARLLGRPANYIPETTPRSIATQIATDCISLRHHAAESLVRLTASLLQWQDRPESCIWEMLSTGPNQLNHVVTQIEKSVSSTDAPVQFARLVLRAPELQYRMNQDLVSAVDVFATWLDYAINLLLGQELQLNTAHNKIKHGLAARARDDLKVTFAMTPPSVNDTISMDAITGPNALDIFDGPVIEVLAEGSRVNGQKQGLELTQLKADAPRILAETYMIAWTHGAMFHVAAARHFDGRVGLPKHLGPPAFPGYPVDGPYPEHVSAENPTGMRFPLTSPPNGGPLKRPAGIAFRNRFIPLKFANTAVRKVRVVSENET